MSRVLVTGASAGAGRSIAIRFAKAGYDLYLAARRPELLESLRSEIERDFGVNVLIQPCDLAREEDVLSLYKTCPSRKKQF